MPVYVEIRKWETVSDQLEDNNGTVTGCVIYNSLLAVDGSTAILNLGSITKGSKRGKFRSLLLQGTLNPM